MRLAKTSFCAVLSVFLFVSISWGATVTINYGTQPTTTTSSPQSTAGGATSQIITPIASNPVILNPDVFKEPLPMFGGPPAGKDTSTTPTQVIPRAPYGVTAGADILWSRHVKAVFLPASYKITPNFKFEVVVPYIEKKLVGEYTGQEITTRGWGDITAGFRYRWGDEDRIVQGITSAAVKFPTGSYEQFDNGQEQLALGTGSYDFVVNQTFSKFVNRFRVILDMGYRFNTKSDYTETNNYGVNVKYENKQGGMFNYLAGVEYYTMINGVVLYGNVLGFVIDRSYAKETNTATGAILRDQDRADRLKTLDAVAGVKIIFTENSGFRLGMLVPIWTEYDPDVTDTQSRDIAVDAGFFVRF